MQCAIMKTHSEMEEEDMLELNQLEQFVTIAKEGTISKAAEVLLISQPALTRSMQKLEDELGVKLFDRKKNKITLNDNGKFAMDYAQNILNDAQKMVTQLQMYDRSHRTISIGSCAPAPIWGLKTVLHKRYPEMNITDELHHHFEPLIDGLQKNVYSLIVLDHPLIQEDVISIPLFQENLYLSLPPAHPLALFKEVSFDDINGESILLYSKIGFWYDLHRQYIPDSHLLVQNDTQVLDELKKASSLPAFRTNITIEREKMNENRVYVPISNPEVHIQFYANFKKQNRKLFSHLAEDIQKIDWRKTKDIK